MNASYFVLVAAALTFATGFFVATIIWGIKLILTPKEVKVHSKSVHLLHIFSTKDLNSEFATSAGASKSSLSYSDKVSNRELYQYHHGKF